MKKKIAMLMVFAMVFSTVAPVYGAEVSVEAVETEEVEATEEILLEPMQEGDEVVVEESTKEESSEGTQAAVEEKKITFLDESGKYLVKMHENWYLKTNEGQPLSGVQYLYIPDVENIGKGFYMFDKNGMLLQKQAVYYFEKQTERHVVFSGYHCTSPSGRFLVESRGLVYLKHLRCRDKIFDGYFYMDDHGRLSNPAQMRKIKAKNVAGTSFGTGYYYFDSYGKLGTKGKFYSLRQTLDGHSFNGSYYFEGNNGSLYRKAGWITVGSKMYYLSSYGRKYTKCWKSGYYLQEDGTIAKNKKVADGTYVDCDGRKCKQEEMALSGLKKQLSSMTSRWGGSWSVYVKNLDTGDVLNLNETAMYPASVIKTFVMAATFDRIKNGKLSYNSRVKELMKEMITVSDNEAYNQLVRLNSSSGNFVQGAAEVNKYLKKNGYTKTACHHTLHPASSSYVGDGARNSSSAKDCGVILEKIYEGTCVSAKYSKEMESLLLRQTRRWKIPAGLPSGVKVANKTGETGSVEHDMAIVYGAKNKYVITVFSANTGYSISGIKKISSTVYHYLN